MPTIRVSAISSWNDCPRRGAVSAFRSEIQEQGYVLRDYRRLVSGAIGTSVHSGMALFMRDKIIEKETSLPEMQDISIETFKTEIEDGVDFDTTTNSINTGERQILNISEEYYRSVAPKIKPVLTEEKLSGDAPGGITVTGHPDILESDSVHDLKTSKKGNVYHGQLGGYSLLVKESDYEIKPIKGVIDWIPRSSIKKPQKEAVSYVYDIALCERESINTIKTITKQWEEFKEKGSPDAFPVNIMSMLCSEKYCTAFGTDFCPISKTFTKTGEEE